MELEQDGFEASRTQAVILLDTNAVIRLEAGDRRARKLEKYRGEWLVSPATVLELQFLWEVGRLKLAKSATIADLVESAQWRVDEPPVIAWFEAASALTWTHDVFDRLIAAHAMTRNLRLATSDEEILRRLGSARTLVM